MIDTVFQINTLTKRFCCISVFLLAHVGSFEHDNELQDFSLSLVPMVAGLQHSQSGMILCSGSIYSSFYVITSCRCLYSFVAIYPFYKERNSPQYRVSVGSENKMNLEILNFVTHPYCMRVKVKKPYKNHFGLIVLAKVFLVSRAVAPLTSFSDIEYTRQQLVHLSEQHTYCMVMGHHSNSGEVKIGMTRMVMMSADECLLRLCIPKIGCSGKRNTITRGEDFCLGVVGDVRLEARFLEGSSVICGRHVFGIVVSTGSSRYPKVPTIFAAVTQYLVNFPDGNIETI